MDIDPSSDSGVSVAGAACPERVPCLHGLQADLQAARPTINTVDAERVWQSWANEASLGTSLMTLPQAGLSYGDSGLNAAARLHFGPSILRERKASASSRRLGGDHGLAPPRTGVSDALRGGPGLVGVIDSRMNLSWEKGHCSRFGRGGFVRWQAAPAFQAAVERVRGAGSARTR